MKMDYIRAFVCIFQEWLSEKTYSVEVHPALPFIHPDPGTKIWLGYAEESTIPLKEREEEDPQDLLLYGTILEYKGDDTNIIEFLVEEIITKDEVFELYPERPLPKQMDEEMQSLLLNRNTHFVSKASMSVRDDAVTFYSNTIDYDPTKGWEHYIYIRSVEGKRYVWFKYEGCRTLIAFYGKFTVPDWLNDLIENPHE
ncbi:hypothetical protein [Chitinophaga silvisoli]|uniref:Uncharacterized protein n=1 Tax=Chitinophaga silvisoli TaxID=2291814 RepID=A0A3E1NVV7_9BACT|nr:hypothetical protein [Chitinophaga silvisoli]RFM32082.1 hypothetical protein DXN04_25180 [Chitinophaga silvisoli]